MPAWASTVAGNTTSQQRQIDKQGTARMGPVSIGPGDGWVRVHDGVKDLMRQDPEEGIQVFVHGSLRSLPGEIEKKASQTYVDGNVRTLVEKDTAQDGRMDGHDARMDGHDSRMDTMQGDINTRATSSWVSSVRSDLQGQVDTKASSSWVSSINSDLNARIDGRASVSWVTSIRDNANSRMDGIDSTVARKAWTTYVNTKASQESVDNLERKVDAAVSYLRNKFPDFNM